MPSRSTSIGAVIVSFFPDEDFPQRVALVKEQVDHVVVVDNGSEPFCEQALRAIDESAITIIWNKDNLGVATALNQGVAHCQTLGYEWILTLDQDSIVQPGMIYEMLKVYEGYPEREKVGMIGPRIIDAGIPEHVTKWSIKRKNTGLLFTRVACRHHQTYIDDVLVLITSGAIMRAESYERLGPYWDELFIDCVDTEYCLRAKSRGLRNIVACRATLVHSLGDKRRVDWLGIPLYPNFHKPFRNYYIFRNKIVMMKTYGLRFPYWLIYDLSQTVFNIIRVLLVERDRRKKLKATLWGLLDGITGSLGPLKRKL